MKKTLLVIAVVLAFCGMVFATNSRIAGLGVPAWMVSSDDSLIATFPGQAVNYKDLIAVNSNSSVSLDTMGTINLLYTEMTGGGINASIIQQVTTPDSGYITLSLEKSVIGVFALPYKGSLLMPPNMMSLGAGFITSNLGEDPHTILTPDRSYGLLYGMKIPDIGLGVMSAGIMLGLADSSQSEKNSLTNPAGNNGTLENFSNGSTAINLGLGLSVHMVDLGISISLPMINNKGTDTNYANKDLFQSETLQSNSGIDFGLNARANLASIVAPIIVGLGFTFDNMQTTDTQQLDGDFPYDGNFTSALDTNDKEVDTRSLIGINFGAGSNLALNDKVTLIPGLAIDYASAKETYKYTLVNPGTVVDNEEIDMSVVSIPLYVAAEGKLNDALVVRGGLSKNLINSVSLQQTQTVTGGVTHNPAPKMTMDFGFNNSVNMSGGVSIKVGAATIDATITGGINADWLPVANIGSLNLKMPGSIASQISAKYAF